MTRKVLNRFTVALVVTSLWTSSVFGQSKSLRPPITVPDNFRGADAISPTAQTSIGDLKWFDVFKDEHLQKLVQTAIVHNYDVRLAAARINAARRPIRGRCSVQAHSAHSRPHPEQFLADKSGPRPARTEVSAPNKKSP